MQKLQLFAFVAKLCLKHYWFHFSEHGVDRKYTDDHLQVSPQTAPLYLQDLCVPVTASRPTSRHHLRPAARADVQVLVCRTSSFGPRSFVASACLRSKSGIICHRHFVIQLTKTRLLAVVAPTNQV